jgi:hypothetical protein
LGKHFGILIGIQQACHTRNYFYDVGRSRPDPDGTGYVVRSGAVENQLQDSLVDTRQVGGPTGLDVLGVQSKGIQVNESVGNSGVVFPRLRSPPVRSQVTNSTVMSVELDLCGRDGVRGQTVRLGRTREIEPIKCGGIGIRSDNPDQLLGGVIESKSVALGAISGSSGLRTSELHLVDQIFMRVLGENSTLHGVQVDEVA